MMEFWFYQIPAKSVELCSAPVVHTVRSANYPAHFPAFAIGQEQGWESTSSFPGQVWFWAKPTLLVFHSSQRHWALLWDAKGLDAVRAFPGAVTVTGNRHSWAPERSKPQSSTLSNFQRLWGLSPAQPPLLLCAALPLFPRRKTVMM